MPKEELPKFSVLMSVYDKDRPQYLKNAIDSILNQTVKPDEIIIVEDGPVNASLEKVIKKYEQSLPYFKVIRNVRNQGLGGALRDGLLRTNNEIVFRMDADDISVKSRFEKQLAILRDGNIDVVGSNIAEYDSHMRNKLSIRRVPENNDQIAKRLKNKNPMNHVTVAFLKSKVLAAGNYRKMEGFEDYYLWARMIKNGSQFYNIQQELVHVRCGREMIKRRGGKNYTRNIIKFEQSLRDLGLISFPRYVLNVSVRIIVSNMPDIFRSYIYKALLREKSQ